MKDKLSTVTTQGAKPIGFVLRSTSQTNFPWLNTKHNSVGAGNSRMCGNMRKYLGDAQVWKTERGAKSYVDTNPRSGKSNLTVVPVYCDPRRAGARLQALLPGEYRGYIIEPKKDFGPGGYLSEGRIIRSGFIAVKDDCNAMPGATWFETVEEAMDAIDTLILVDGNADKFWEIVQPFPYTHVGQRADFKKGEVVKGRFQAVIEDYTVIAFNPNYKQV